MRQKLQVAPAGAWRDVVEFDASRSTEVRIATRMLRTALGRGANGEAPSFRCIKLPAARSPKIVWSLS